MIWGAIGFNVVKEDQQGWFGQSLKVQILVKNLCRIMCYIRLVCNDRYENKRPANVDLQFIKEKQKEIDQHHLKPYPKQA